MSDETMVEVPLSLLYRIDSIASLIYWRERHRAISAESTDELLRISGEVRRITDRVEGKRR